MSSNQRTTEVIDKLLLVSLTGGTLATSLFLPGTIVGLAPVMEKYFKGYNKRQKEREYRRLVSYMKRQNLLKLEPRSGNGLVLTNKGKARAQKANLEALAINTDREWDGRWRLVIFDVPEKLKTQRDVLTFHLRRLGLYQLQKSVWVHPYEVRPEVEAIAVTYGVEPYLTLVEAASIDNHATLKKHFPHTLKKAKN